MSHPIWVSKGGNLSFQDILESETKYIDAWATIVKHWIFEPCRHLALNRNTTDRGMALLMLELAFFEPLGSIITGQESTGNSRKMFATGLKEFASWLRNKDIHERELIGEVEQNILCAGADTDQANAIFSFARCGLMHSMTMQGGQIFIDALGIGKFSITDYKYAISSLSKKGEVIDSETILLIDPWRLLIQMEEFTEFFVNKLRSAGNDSQAYRKFVTTFERIIIRPGKVYLGLEKPV
ncbi:hypothetical protein [Gluconobacter oxydans]|uniref:hypothetical protein n=1 Tax=Gluconobacter oxydans TaxID=442 RepID=UPI0020A1484E|nr:hypothetical protein [Gluconobacter oxydans]MCP1249894.1 hypothetical protein [Gluconobacter oxydans]